MSRFRILSLDGGGIKGTFSASVLANFEKMTGKRVVDYFDLITGTSTGGIIALGLGLGMSAQEVLDFYVDRGPDIFPSTGTDRVVHGIRHVFKHKYSPDGLDAALTDVFGERKLGESSCRLVIPSFDCNAGRVQLFKTAHHKKFVQDYKHSAREAAMATAAAPTYFPAFNSEDGQSYFDGGIWANCPIMIGLLEAVFVLESSPFDIDVLSIGTTETPFDVSKKTRLGGYLTWNSTLLKMLTQAQTDSALAQAKVITARPTKRIAAVTRPGKFAMDDSSRIEELRGLGTFNAKIAVDDVANRFLDTPAEQFVPCHEVSPDGTPRPPRRRKKVPRDPRRRSLGTALAGSRRVPHNIVDISATGALIETETALPVGDAVDLDLELENGAVAQVRARVARVQHPRWGVVPGVGVRFTHFEGDAKTAIESYVESGEVWS